MAEVLLLLRGVDAQDDRKRPPVGGYLQCIRQPSAVGQPLQAGDIEDLLTGQPQRLGGIAVLVLQRQDAHAHQVGTMDPLEALRQHGPNPEERGPLGRPVTRRSRAVFLAGEDHQGNAVGLIPLGGVVDRHLLPVREVPGHAALGTGSQLVAEANVGEGAPDHDLVIAPTGAVLVEIGRLHAAVDQPSPGGAVAADVPGRGDVVGGDAVAQLGQHPGPSNVRQRKRRHAHAVEVRRFAHVGGGGVPLVGVARRHVQLLPAVVALVHGFVGRREHP